MSAHTPPAAPFLLQRPGLRRSHFPSLSPRPPPWNGKARECPLLVHTQQDLALESGRCHRSTQQAEDQRMPHCARLWTPAPQPTRLPVSSPSPRPQGGMGVCLGVDLVLLLPGATSRGSQAPQASRQAPDSQLLEAGPSCAGHGFLLCSLPPSLPAAPATLSSAQVLTGHQVTYLQGSLSHPQAWVPLAHTHPLHLVISIPLRPHSLQEAIPDYPQPHQAGSPGLPSAEAAWSSAASPPRH